MTYTALPQFQAAVITILRLDDVFMALVTGVFDEVPATPRYPHVIVDDPFETPDRTFGQNGHSCSLTLSIFTQSPSTKKLGAGKGGFGPGLEIAESALALLSDVERAPITIDGHDVVDCDVLSIDCSREADGLTRRIDVTLIALLEDAP